MLTIKEILAVKPKFILSVNYDAGSIGEMVGEDRNLNLYLAEMTIQYHSLTNNACLAFTIECLVSVNDDIVTIDEMDTCNDSHYVYSSNIKELKDINGQGVTIWEYGAVDTDLHELLERLIEEQPIYDIPEHYTIESY